jgi:hypothetical protein
MFGVSRRLWVATGIALVGLAITVEVVVSRSGPILKGWIIETLRTRFRSRVDLDDLQVSVLRGLEIEGEGLRIYRPEGAAGSSEPIISVAHFSFHSGIVGLFFKPMHVGTVTVSGLEIKTFPHGDAKPGGGAAGGNEQKKGKIKIVVDEIICEDSRLIIGTSKPDKDPKDFELKHIVLRDVGPNAPWDYDARLTNAIPRGEIHAKGTFGPWQVEDPGQSTVTGHYTFDHADLNTIKGIGGILSSVGDFKGQLDRIVVDGTSDTPAFSLDSANNPVPLQTKFHVIVDGTSGDTYLQPVEAVLGQSRFITSGSLINIKGKGHRIDLDLDVKDCRLEDFLKLAVKTRPPVMTALITTKSKLQIQAGKQDVLEKLGLEGQFTLAKIQFTSTDVQDKVDMLSLRAQGRPKEAKPGAPEVAGSMQGTFALASGLLTFSNLNYEMPGADVNLTGEYSLDGQKFEFRGHVLTKADIAHMVASSWKAFLLEPASLLFRKKGGGASIPVAISGTQGKPKFGIELIKRQEEKDGK